MSGGISLANIFGQQPFQGTAQLQQQNTSEQSTGLEERGFSPQQQALQGQSLGFITQLLGGQVPQAFSNLVNNDAIRQAAFQDFARYRAPQLAAQFGAGTPVINKAMEDLQLRLAAQQAEQARFVVPQAVNAFEAAARFAFTPINVATRANRDLQSTTNQQTVNADLGELSNLALNVGGSIAHAVGPFIF